MLLSDEGRRLHTVSDLLRSDVARLDLATDADVCRVSGDLADGLPTAAISDWRLIALRVRPADEWETTLHLVGESSGEPTVTSPVVLLDASRGLAQTESGSVYRLVGAVGDGQPDIEHMSAILRALARWGYQWVGHVPGRQRPGDDAWVPRW